MKLFKKKKDSPAILGPLISPKQAFVCLRGEVIGMKPETREILMEIAAIRVAVANKIGRLIGVVCKKYSK